MLYQFMIGNDVLQSCSLYFVQTLSKMTTTLKLSRPDETLTTYKYILFWLVKLVIADPHLMLHVSCHPLMPVHQIICHVNRNRLEDPIKTCQSCRGGVFLQESEISLC